MKRIVPDVGTGWVNLTRAECLYGWGEDLYRTLSGVWVRKTPGPNWRARYERVTLERAHAWLVHHRYYPDPCRDSMVAL